MRAAERAEPHLGEAPVQNLPLLDQLLHRGGDVLDGNLGIDTVLVQQVDTVCTQAPEHPLDDLLDVRRLAVRGRLARSELSGLRVDVPAELGRDHYVVPERLDRFTEDAFHSCGSVGLCRVEKRDASIEGAPDVGDHLRPEYGTVVSNLRAIFWTRSPMLDTSSLPRRRRAGAAAGDPLALVDCASACVAIPPSSGTAATARVRCRNERLLIPSLPFVAIASVLSNSVSRRR